MSRRPPLRKPGRGDPPLLDARTRALLRGAGKFLAVVVVAGAAGALLGMGLAALTGADSSSAPSAAPARATAPGSPTEPSAAGTVATATKRPTKTTGADRPTATETKPTGQDRTETDGGQRFDTEGSATATATTTTPAATSGPRGAGARGKLPVEILSTIVHPVTASAGDSRRRARVDVHVRITNRTGRAVKPAPPTLLVGDARVPISSGFSKVPLRPGGVADGTLRFDTEGAVSGRLTTARVRLFIVDKLLLLRPRIGSAVAPG